MDADAAIEDLECGRSIGLKGVNFPTPKIFMQPYNDPAWDPFFSACEDLDVTLCNLAARVRAVAHPRARRRLRSSRSR